MDIEIEENSKKGRNSVDYTQINKKHILKSVNMSPIKNSDFISISRYGRPRKPKYSDDYLSPDEALSLSPVNGTILKTKQYKNETIDIKKTTIDSEISEKSRVTLNIPSDNDIEIDYNNVLKIVSQNTSITSPTIHKPLKTYSNRKKTSCFKSLSFNESVISQLDTFSWTESVPESVFKCGSDDSPVRKSNLLSPINSIVKIEFNDKSAATNILSEFEDLVLKTEHEDEIKCSMEGIGKDADLKDILKWELDDLIWARIGNYPFWPCVICLDPEKNVYFLKKVQVRSKAPIYYLHVRFFGDGGRRSWVAEHLILRYEGEKALFEISKQIRPLKSNQKLLNAFVVPERSLHKWKTAVAEIELYSLSSKEERATFFNRKIQPEPIKYNKRKREDDIDDKNNVKKQKTVENVEVNNKTLHQKSSPKLPEENNVDVEINNRTLRQKSSPKLPEENNVDVELNNRTLRQKSSPKLPEENNVDVEINNKTLRQKSSPKPSEENNENVELNNRTLRQKSSLKPTEENNVDVEINNRTLRQKSSPKPSEENNEIVELNNRTLRQKSSSKHSEENNVDVELNNRTLRQKSSSKYPEENHIDVELNNRTLRQKSSPKPSEENNVEIELNNRTLRQKSSPKPSEDDVNEISKKNLKKKTSNNSLEDFTEKITHLIKKRRPNLFKGVTRDHVCVHCEKPGDVYKCNGVCKRYYHLSCVEILKNGILQLVPITQQLDTEEGEPKSSKRKLSIAEQIDAKMREIMDEIGTTIKYSDSTEDSSSDSETNTTTSEVKFHVTGDGIFHDKKEKKQRVSVEMYCADCSRGVLPPCFVCARYVQPERQSAKLSLQEENENLQENDTSRSSSLDRKVNSRNRQSNLHENGSSSSIVEKLTDRNVDNKSNVEYRQKCSLYHCTKFYHPACLKSWPQVEWSLSSTKSFICPYHSCHTCISDNPRGTKPRFNNEKLAKCIRCPTTYHLSNFCIPAGTNILNANHIICPKHTEEDLVKPNHINANWCFICSEGGSLICCETCPTSFHAECLNIKFPEGSYICEDCESGRYPLYNEVIWVKLGTYRWWPGHILFPEDIPDNVKAIVHNRRDFVVRFFGSHDHYWVNKSRVFLYQEGDSGHSSSKKSSVNGLFVRANEEAAIAHKLFKEMQAHREAETNSGLKPPPYIRIKTNKLVGNVKSFELHPNSMTSCDCDPNSEHPCGPDTDCLNRLLLTECSPQVCPAGDRCQNQNFEKRLYPALVPFRTAAGRGWGLKTLEPLSKGRFVIEYVGEMIDETEYRRRLQHMSEMKDENYYFLTIDKDRMLDAGPKGNVARFMNHSCEPNCETQKWTVNGDTRVGLFALKDVEADTEITFNYNLECVGKEMKPCHCGTSKCSGFIGGKIKQDEVPKAEKKVVKAKKNKKNKQQSLNSCFACSKANTEVQCSVKYCLKKYHLECAGLESVPVDKYSCIRHSCQICAKKYVKMCLKCVNSYCAVHKKSNMAIDASTGEWQCLKHKKMKSKNVVGKKNVENSQEIENVELIDWEEEIDKTRTNRQKGKNSQEMKNMLDIEKLESVNDKKNTSRQKGKNSQEVENVLHDEKIDGGKVNDKKKINKQKNKKEQEKIDEATEEANDKKKANRQKDRKSQEIDNILNVEKTEKESKIVEQNPNDKKKTSRQKDRKSQELESVEKIYEVMEEGNDTRKTNRQKDRKSQELEKVEKIDEVIEEANDKKKTNRQKSQEMEIVLNVEKTDKQSKITENNLNDKKKMNRQKGKKSQEIENVEKIDKDTSNEVMEEANNKKKTNRQKDQKNQEIENVLNVEITEKGRKIVEQNLNDKKKTKKQKGKTSKKVENVKQKVNTRQNVKNDGEISTQDKINTNEDKTKKNLQKNYKKKCKVLSSKVIKKKMFKKNLVLINNNCKKLRSFKKNR